MERIKFIIFTVFLLATNSLIAQEKQNDATWEETVAFIEKYKGDLSFKFALGGRFDQYCEVINIVLTGTEMGIYPYQQYCYQWYDSYGPDTFSIKLPHKINLDLKNLKAYEKNKLLFISKIDVNYQGRTVYEDKTIDGYTIKAKETEFNESIYSTYAVNLIFEGNLELKQRLEKAFKHLAYLATEKRKQEREASGDKF